MSFWPPTEAEVTRENAKLQATTAARARWEGPLPECPKPSKPVADMTAAEVAAFGRQLEAYHANLPKWRTEREAMRAMLKDDAA